MQKDRLRQIVVVLVTFITIVMNILANALPLNGQNTGEISDRFRVFFVPAGYVFAIWGVIYIGLIAFAIYQALPAQRDNPRLRAIGWLTVAAGVANVAWLFAWHFNQFPVTLVAMLSLLTLLVVIYLRLGIGKTAVSTGEQWAVRIPFQTYLGWITVATIANVTDVLNYLGWNGGFIQPEMWAVLMLVAAVVITGAVLFTRRDFAYPLVIIWASIGIAVKQSAAALVPQAAIAAAVLVALMFIITVLRKTPASLSMPTAAR